LKEEWPISSIKNQNIFSSLHEEDKKISSNMLPNNAMTSQEGGIFSTLYSDALNIAIKTGSSNLQANMENMKIKGLC